MAWNDAIRLPYAKSRTTVHGYDHLLRVVADVMDAEQEELPEDVVAHPKPVRSATQNGVIVAPPSWRVRVTEHAFPFQALLQRGDRIPQITEVEVVDLIGRVTGTAQAELKSNRDDPAADWKIAAYQIVGGVAKKARVRELDPLHAAKMSEWRGRYEALAAAGQPALTPAKQITVLKELPGFTLVVVWVDMARQDEPRRGDGKPSALGTYMDTGYFPAPYQEQRDRGFAIIRARQAEAGGLLRDLPANVGREIVGLSAAGSTPERIAQLLQLPLGTVRRVVNAAQAALEPPAALTAPVEAPKKRAPRKPKSENAPQPQEKLPPEV